MFLHNSIEGLCFLCVCVFFKARCDCTFQSRDKSLYDGNNPSKYTAQRDDANWGQTHFKLEGAFSWRHSKTKPKLKKCGMFLVCRPFFRYQKMCCTVKLFGHAVFLNKTMSWAWFIYIFYLINYLGFLFFNAAISAHIDKNNCNIVK